jgi:hypothetical protein
MVAIMVSALTSPVFGAEEWPPPTPPRGPADASPVSIEPPTAPPAAEIEVEPPAPSPASASETAPSSSAVETVRVAASPPSRSSSLYGLTGTHAFVRTPGDGVVLFPGGLVQLDGHSFEASDLSVPDTRLWLRRARPELAGWLGPHVYFDAAADFANGASLRGVDDYAAFAPRGDRVIVQVGQFDAPFMLENQTRDRDLDFVERSLAARTFAIPENKKRGAMVHGTNPERNYYWAAGGFLGEGESDLMARGWVAPFSFTDPEILKAITLGASARVGNANSGASLSDQTTEGGVVFLEPATTWLDGADSTAVALRPRGRLDAVALEVNAPFGHRGGVRFEWTAKNEPLTEVSALNGAAAVTQGGFGLSGWSTYGEAWCWLLGDDRAAGQAGLELPLRLERPFGLSGPLTAIMIAARLEHLDETVTAPSGATAAAEIWSVGNTMVTAAHLGVNAWLGERLRITLEYAWNRLGGNTLFSTSFTNPNIQELSARISLAL